MNYNEEKRSGHCLSHQRTDVAAGHITSYFQWNGPGWKWGSGHAFQTKSGLSSIQRGEIAATVRSAFECQKTGKNFSLGTEPGVKLQETKVSKNLL